MHISVIIVTCNYAHFIGEAIQSVLSQTLIPDELIVIDDGSSDHTARVVLPYTRQFSWIKYYPHDQRGVAAARNFGIHIASGEWLAFLDADDLLLPTKLEKQLTFHLKNPNAKLSTTRQIFKFEANYDLPHYLAGRDLSIPQVNIGTATLMFHRELVATVGDFNLKLKVGEYLDWIKRADKMGYQRVMLDEPLLIRRLHTLNTSYLENKINEQNTNRAIIIGGCHRSGTSLLRRIIDSHSRIHCGPEIKFFRDFFNDYPVDPIKKLRYATTARSILDEDQLFLLFGKTFIELHQQAMEQHQKTRWADKNPENIIYLKQWNLLLDDAWVFVHIIRHPLDTLAAMDEVHFNWAYPSELQDRITFYRRYTVAGFDFEQQHPGRYKRVLYEDLVTHPQKTIADLMYWLGEKFEERQLNFNHIPHQEGLEDSKVKDTTTIHAKSVGRWQSKFTPEQAQSILQDTHDIIQKVGWQNIEVSFDKY